MSRFVALGVFDGVHVGHQVILGEMVREARASGAATAAVTFEPHPDAVLNPAGGPCRLTTPEEKARLIRALGVEEVAVIPFTAELARLPARAFLADILRPRFRPSRVFVGYNFTFGHRGAGNPFLLAERGPRLGFTVRTFPPIAVEGEVVSSTAVRRLLLRGEVEAAARFLGRPHRLRGRVLRGDGRGRALGFPTANTSYPAGLCRPARGVYAVRVTLEPEAGGAGGVFSGVANLGRRPTFARGGTDAEMDTLEVHLLDFDGDLYGKEIDIAFLCRLRGEMPFPSVEALRRQIALDVEEARRRSSSCGAGAVQVK